MKTIRNIEDDVSVKENENMAEYEARHLQEARERTALRNLSMSKNVRLALQVVEFLRTHELIGDCKGLGIETFTLEGLAGVLRMDRDVLKEVLNWLGDAGFVRRSPLYLLSRDAEVPAFSITEDGKVWSYLMIGMSDRNPFRKLSARISRLVDNRRRARIQKQKVLWTYKLSCRM